MKILNVLFFLIAINGFSQKTESKYRWCDPSGLLCSTIEFYDGKFNQISAGDIGIHIKNRGYYQTIKDTLILTYDNPIDKRVEIREQTKMVDSLGSPLKSTLFDIEVIDENSAPSISTIVALRDKNDKIIKSGFVDKSGKYSVMLSDLTEVDNVFLGNMNDEVVIKIKDYLYLKNRLRVIMTLDKYRYDTFRGIKKYLIKKGKSKDELRLFDIQNDVLFIFKKV